MLTIDQLLREKNDGIDFRKRRHPQWTDNYQLYRDTVITNRITQRQSVNVPLMKATIKTLQSKLTKPTNLYFDELDGDDQKELFYNEYWRYFTDAIKFHTKEHVDDKQELLYGRTFQKLNIVGGMPYIEIIDPMDVAVDRYVDPSDLNTAHSIVHSFIYRTMGDIERNPMYDRAAVSRLRELMGTRMGLIKSETNTQAMTDRNERLRSLGDSLVNNPRLSETYVELTEYQRKEWNPQTKQEDIVVYVTAENQEILMRKPLQDIFNINEYTWTSWGSDVERTDFWSDGEADIVRVPNQILNVWISQLVENRTLRNYGMHYYDQREAGEWSPTTIEPRPFGWYGLPFSPQQSLQRVDIPDLSESIDEMQYVVGLVEQATAATAIEKGTGSDKQITLGEVQLLAAKAMDRITNTAELRMKNRIEIGEKWARLVNANPDKLDAVKLWKKSVSGKMYSRIVRPNDWRSRVGYACRAIIEQDKNQEAIESLQKMFAARQLFQANPTFDKIAQERALDVAGLTLEQKQQVMDAEEQKLAGPVALPQPGQAQLPPGLLQPTSQQPAFTAN